MHRLREIAARRGYHHGHLKQALVDAARSLVEERGPHGFTLVEAARLAGVSASAPYRHFTDRQALLAALAQTGFEVLAERLRAAWAGGHPDAAAAFARMGSSYLGFAISEPGYYAAMFTAGLPQEDRDLAAASAAAFEVLLQGIAGVAACDAGEAERRRLALEVWALTHGVASLAASGALGRAAPDTAAEDVLREGVTALLATTRSSTEGKS